MVEEETINVQHSEEPIDAKAALDAEYSGMRDDFDFGFVIVGAVIVLILLYCTGVIGGKSSSG